MHHEIDQDTLSLLAQIHHDEREFNIFFNWYNKFTREKARERKMKMDTSSNVSVKLNDMKPGTSLAFKIYRLQGTPRYEVYWLKVQRGIPAEYHAKFPNHESLNDTYYLSIWNGDPNNKESKKVSTTQISGDINTIGLIARLIMKKGVAEQNVNPKNPNGIPGSKLTDKQVAETYNF